MREPKTDAGKALREMLRQFLTDYTGMHVTPRDADRVVAVLGLTWDAAVLRASGEWVLVPKAMLLNPVSRQTRQLIENQLEADEACGDKSDRAIAATMRVVLERLDRLHALTAAPKPEDKA